MLKIRLQRMGKKKQPTYRVIVSENTKDTQAGSLEILGQYDPVSKPKRVNFNVERIKHWLQQGAQASDTVYNLLVQEGILSGDKKRTVSLSKKRTNKIEEKNKVAEEEKAKAAEKASAKAVAEEEAKKVEQAVSVEEPIVEEKTAQEPSVETEIKIEDTQEKKEE